MAEEKERVYNFSAGPAMLPREVLETAAKEMLSFRGSGMSFMECSHRGAEFKALYAELQERTRRVLKIPDNYSVLFCAGGATHQFAYIPLNLCGPEDVIDVVQTGNWSKKFAEEAGRYCKINIASKSSDFIPAVETWKLTEGAKFIYFCDNETIHGVEFPEVPKVPEDRILIADMSSNLFSRPVDISKFGLLYACAQKNFGPAGCTLVIVRNDLIVGGPKQADKCPIVGGYELLKKKDSAYNTPPTYNMYIINLVLKWIEETIGGLDKMAEINAKKADLLYKYIDESEHWSGIAKPEFRSRMNIPFRCTHDDMQAKFLEYCKPRGLITLKGYRTMVGSFRASIYNAMPLRGVEKLVEAMKDFERDMKF
ncbi:Phosphoserine aminotransferase [Aduncisulcus paluster]|uniref:phosphoserine transaminase n=1 Tax=Aduncisulcus paluster TaxID=2918883 RepID=A0ABQ5K2A7_9EUKA|nr:Phosphoserine aminotransferase [Aduncisulcus paluster]|eukprot:gnl/Carplike_NY0171/164_a240_4349.p1 GENE.gnl/Carplike_NY0171/164_a240_4349~~gnl/Carplike_NY0171/164_a240_4349.p1  ORF type:complete len:368 (-),score=123.26 gnl/Carplike_NY0171/164_a240_4349:118-1221(-)